MGTLIDSQLCRICAEEASLHCPLFDESSRILRERMGFFLPLNIQETSLMPQIVCQKCVESLESLVVFFNRLNQGQLKLFSELAEHKKNRVVPWNGKKMSLFDKKYPSGVVSKPAKNKAIEEFSAGPTFAAVGDNILIEGYSSGGDIKAFEDASMKFECLEPSCRLRFQSYEEIEEHLKIENHSSLTVVHSSEEVNENKESDRLGELSGTQESLNNFNLETTAPQGEALFRTDPFYNRNLDELLEGQSSTPCIEAPTATKDLDCSVCAMKFHTKDNLEAHQASHEDEKKFSCEKCGKQFRQRSTLMQHIKLHGDSRVFNCEYCSKSFSRKSNLQEHIRTHTGEKPYSCGLCGDRFKTSSQVRLHEKRHSGEKPWTCELCSKAFLHQSTWKYHLRRHKGEKTHVCTICQKAFTELWALKKHARIHKGEKPYPCPSCERSFADSSNLNKHLAKAHPPEKKKGEEESGNLIYEAIKSAYTLNHGDKSLLGSGDTNVNEVIYITLDGNDSTH